MCAYPKYKEGAVFVGKDNHIYAVRKFVMLKGNKNPCAGCCFSDTQFNECLHNTLQRACGTNKCSLLIPGDMIFKDITKGV